MGNERDSKNPLRYVVQRRRVVRQKDGSLREFWEDVGIISAMAAPLLFDNAGVDVLDDVGDILEELF